MMQARAQVSPNAIDVGNDSTPLVSTENLSVIFRGSRGSVTALQDINVSVGRGEFVSVIGPSGCGKSTLTRVFSGLLKPTHGTAYLKGAKIDRPRGDVGMVFQQANLLPWKTVLDNVLVPARALRQDISKAREAAMDLLRLVGLERFAHNYPSELSGGMQQRVGIARGLIHNPDLLLMDEPFSALDTMTRDHMSLELQRIWMARKTSAIFITHSISEAVFLSDRVLVMSARPGTIVEDIKIDLPRPRTLETMASPEFAEYCLVLRRLFEQLVHFN
ncbi:ATP-binding cassette domain-containing protein [Bordetella sp. 15P40C-2]|nr:ATP-binding cassette domain-containing protein [Bordetella sp. 15P40C-2]